MRATHATDLARATPRPTGGDGDGPLADGRTPVECRAHCASSTGRQRRLARVEPVGRGGANGGGVALRPPFTPRKIGAKSSQRDRKGRGGRGGQGSRLGLGAGDNGVVMGYAARKSQKPALELGGGGGGAWVPCVWLQVSGESSCEPTMRTCRASRTRAQWRLSPPP